MVVRYQARRVIRRKRPAVEKIKAGYVVLVSARRSGQGQPGRNCRAKVDLQTGRLRHTPVLQRE